MSSFHQLKSSITRERTPKFESVPFLCSLLFLSYTSLINFVVGSCHAAQTFSLGTIINLFMVSAPMLILLGESCYVFGWFKRSLNQSIGSFSCNPHFALLWPDERSDILGNVSDH